MAMPTDLNDVLHRTMHNLEIVAHAANEFAQNGQSPPAYEATQLVNSFLMTVLQNWDGIRDGWSTLTHSGANWPKIATSEKNQTAKDCIGKIRDALAHGLFAFEGENGEISAMHLWTCPKKPEPRKVDWHARISLQDMHEILKCFVLLATGKNLQFRSKKSKGDGCP